MYQQPEPESKARETLRYLGYIIVPIGGLILLALITYYLPDIFALIMEFIFLIIIIGFVVGLVVAGLYMLFKRDNNHNK
ncbi:MAG: hypothetical protein KAS16_02095 [Thermoplasmata archaeon]|nr:hypothetical protein [Thermoplasmata archaeon]